MSRFIISLVVIFLLSACTHYRSPILGPVRAGDGYVNPAGPNQLFHENNYEIMDLAKIINPDQADEIDTSSIRPKPLKNVDVALQQFYARAVNTNLDEERNRIQHRLMGISEQRCSTYKFYLKRLETSQSIYTGIAATLFGGIGAMFSSGDAARIFSGLAGIASGTGAELKQGYFSNAASSVIIPGINLSRAEIRQKIQEKRGASIKNYTLEEALMDVSTFHDACSINAGLERAGEAVNQIANPGIQVLNETLFKLRHSNQIIQHLQKEMSGEVSAPLNSLYAPEKMLAKNGLYMPKGYLETALSKLAERSDKLLSIIKKIENQAQIYAVQCKDSPSPKVNCTQLQRLEAKKSELVPKLHWHATQIVTAMGPAQLEHISRLEQARIQQMLKNPQAPQWSERNMLLIEAYVDALSQDWDAALTQLDNAVQRLDVDQVEQYVLALEKVVLRSDAMPGFYDALLQ